MSQIENVARTAFLISELRASEAGRTPKLFDDPFASLFSTPDSRNTLARMEGVGTFFSTGIRVRTRWVDDVVRRELDRGTKQVLILGAGLDCRALRFARPDVRFFEVDAPALLAFKAERLEKAGHPRGAAAIGFNYLAPGLFDQLRAHGFDDRQRTLVLWEGNTFYLRPEEVQDLLRLLGASLADANVVFDYFGTAVIEARSRVPAMNVNVATMRSIGAPWQCGIDDVAALARATGFEVSQNVSLEELVQRFLPAEHELVRVPLPEFGMCVLARSAAAAG